MMDLNLLNEWAATVWAPWLLRGAVQATLVALVVGACWMLLRRRASAHLGAALLILPWIPLLAPVPNVLAIELPVDLHHELPVQAPAATGPGSLDVATSVGPQLEWVAGDLSASVNETPAAHPNVAASGGSRAALPQERDASRLPLLTFWIWCMGLLLGLARFAAAQARTRRLVDQAQPLRDPRVRLLLRRAAAEAGLPSTPRLLESSAVASPAAWGVLRPTVLLPEGFAARVDDAALGWTLHHELAHITRRDLITAALVRVLRAVFWFNPLAWWLESAGAELRECACDEVALATLPELPRRRAAEALLDVIEAARVAGPRRLALESLHSNRHRLEKRLMRLIDTKRATQLRLTPAAFLGLTLTAGLGFASTQLTTRAPEAELSLVASAEVARDEAPGLSQALSTPPSASAPKAALQDPEEVAEEPQEERIEELPLAHPEATAALGRARDYLLLLQRDDGRWETGNPQMHVAGEFSDVGVTAFAVEALRHSPQTPHRDAAARGLRWIAEQQDPATGLFGKRDNFCYMPSHAVATSLWFDAHPDGLDAESREIAEKAVSFLMRARNPYGAWRYDYPPTGDNDSFITSLCLSALARAERAGIEFDVAAIRDGRAYLDEVTDPESGRVGYLKLGGPPPRLVSKKEDFPVKYSEYPTAAAVVARLDLGDDPIDEDDLVSAAAVVARVAPRWDPVKGTNDAYHWLWGTRALRPLGGVMWKRWQRGLFESLVPNQRAGGDWPLQDAWSGQNDRAHITAVYGLALQEALRD